MRCCYCNDPSLPPEAFRPRKDTASGRAYVCIACERKNHTAWQAKKVAAGFCYVCRRRKKTPGKRRCKFCIRKATKKYAARSNAERIRQNAMTRERASALKQEVYAAYGGYRCACCGETHEEFLTVDHVKGDGKKHRLEVGSGGRGFALYRWLKRHKFPEGFQILCMNCNFALGHSGYCPHKVLTSKGEVNDHQD